MHLTYYALEKYNATTLPSSADVLPAPSASGGPPATDAGEARGAALAEHH